MRKNTHGVITWKWNQSTFIQTVALYNICPNEIYEYLGWGIPSKNTCHLSQFCFSLAFDFCSVQDRSFFFLINVFPAKAPFQTMLIYIIFTKSYIIFSPFLPIVFGLQHKCTIGAACFCLCQIKTDLNRFNIGTAMNKRKNT